jgi:DNA-binding response OmpR family regulator
MLSTILVVDDEAELRRILQEVLSAPGWTVLTAASGYEALRILVDRHVDLLVADVRMPGVDGFELARQAKLMRPNLQIMYISGYFAEAQKEAGLTYGPILSKPIRARELVAEIKRRLSSH